MKYDTMVKTTNSEELKKVIRKDRVGRSNIDKH